MNLFKKETKKIPAAVVVWYTVCCSGRCPNAGHRAQRHLWVRQNYAN